jgi:hypothetical protein
MCSSPRISRSDTSRTLPDGGWLSSCSPLITGTQSSQSAAARSGSGGLQAAGDVRCLEEHGDNYRGRSGSVGNPVAPRLDPCPPRPSKLWVGSRRGQPRTGRTFNLRLGICQRSIQRPNRGVASKGLIVAAKGADLLQRLAGVADQRRATVPRRCPRRASIRSSAARSSSCTTEAGTIRPAARSASLRASAASSSASLGIGGSRSAGCLRCGVSSMRERIGRPRPMFQCGASPGVSDLQHPRPRPLAARELWHGGLPARIGSFRTLAMLTPRCGHATPGADCAGS